MTSQDFKTIMSQKNDKELLNIINGSRDDYQLAAFEAAKDEFARRNLSLSENNLKEIANEIYHNVNTKSDKDFIIDFEKHIESIEKCDYNETPEKFTLYKRLLSDYAISLANEASYLKALPQIKKAMAMYESSLEYYISNNAKDKIYELLLWNRGRSHFYLEKYKLAQLDFELLTKKYPENTIYNIWLRACRNQVWYKIRTILWYIAIGPQLVITFVEMDVKLKLFITGMSLLCLLVALGIELTIYLQKRKKHN
jgi:tetratricopeptide (TPR) repeat protein